MDTITGGRTNKVVALAEIDLLEKKLAECQRQRDARAEALMAAPHPPTVATQQSHGGKWIKEVYIPWLEAALAKLDE